MATIQQVARRAGVGVGTVSRVLNGGASVSDDTRRRVQAVIDELDYHPSRQARGLSLGRTHTLGVMVPFVTQQSAVERIRGAVQRLAGSNYDVVLYDVESPFSRDATSRRIAKSRSVDGLLVVSLPPLGEMGAFLAEASIPVVLVDCRHPELTSVVIDDVAGGHMATTALIELGHRRIAFIGDEPMPGFGFTAAVRRRQGYEAALADHDLQLSPELVRLGPHDQNVARQQAAELLALPEPPTAVFAASDRQALGVLEAARDAGAAVPGELSVIGFDDIEVARYADLSTVRQPLRASGVRGAELLLEALAGEGTQPCEEELPLDLVHRGTTAPP